MKQITVQTGLTFNAQGQVIVPKDVVNELENIGLLEVLAIVTRDGWFTTPLQIWAKEVGQGENVLKAATDVIVTIYNRGFVAEAEPKFFIILQEDENGVVFINQNGKIEQSTDMPVDCGEFTIEEIEALNADWVNFAREVPTN